MILLLLAAPLALAETGSGVASGDPLPRYATLKTRPVNARGGPGEDYKLLWVYPSRGLPLQIVEESGDWRRVCDPEGGLGWVHRRALDARRSVMRTQPSDLILRDQPSEAARASAVMAGRSTAEVLTCKAGWCRVSVDRAKGWVRTSDVWGLSDRPQCRG